MVGNGADAPAKPWVTEGTSATATPGVRAAARSWAATITARRAAAGGIGALVVVWALLILLVPSFRFVVYDPRARTGLEVFLAAISLFLSLVLFLFPDDDGNDRLRWVGLGFALLGTAGVLFGYLMRLVDPTENLNRSLYSSLLTRTVVAIVMATGLTLRRPPQLPPRRAVLALECFVLLGVALWLTSDRFPRLIDETDVVAGALDGRTVLPGLTGWHWSLAVVPLVAATVAAVAPLVASPLREVPTWLCVALVLMAGWQLHTMLWPTAYSSILTTASALRIGFTTVIGVGGFFQLRRVAAERAALLAVERETAARQARLIRLHADFTAMVRHELASPLAAVRRSAELLAGDPLTTAQARALTTIERQVGLLDALVADAQANAHAERENFAVAPQPVPVAVLLADARDYAETLPGRHPVRTEIASDAWVMADPERIAQVLHNLLDNAAKYTPDGVPITLRAEAMDGAARISVEDQGPGIAVEDLPHIFERYGRGADPAQRAQPGKGLGLYLSRRIVQAHGSDLRVDPAIDAGGARFWFDLEVVS